MTKITTVSLTDIQAKYVEKNCISLTKIIKQVLNEKINRDK